MALTVELVAVDRKVWSGEATAVYTRTVDGEIGILPGHIDHLSVLVDGCLVDIRHGDERTLAAVDGGFLLVHDDNVRILAETAELGPDVDVDAARSTLEQSRGAAPDDEEAQAAGRRADARLRAAGQPS
jgi:F-type H+-transporting ATPase subunit epsilon